MGHALKIKGSCSNNMGLQKSRTHCSDAVDGRNPTPPGTYKTPVNDGIN